MKNKILAIVLMLVSTGALLLKIGSGFSVLWLLVGGLVSLYLLNDLDELKRKFNIKVYFLGMLASIVTLIITGLMNQLFNANPTANPAGDGTLPFVVLFITVIVPSLIGEELLTLVFYKAVGGKVLGVIVSTAVFVLAHGFEYQWNIWQLASLVAIRLVFTAVLIKKGIQTSAAVHITYDTLIFAMAMGH